MFPIYGCGALLGPIGKWIDDWLNPGRVLTVKKSDLAVRHGMLYMVLIFVAKYASGACHGECVRGTIRGGVQI